MHRAILIDPETQTIQETTWDGTYEHMKALIGDKWIEVVHMGEGECLILDDEGLLLPPAEQHLFYLDTHGPAPLCGKGLVLGLNEEGDNIATKLTLEQVAERVTFAPDAVVTGFETREGYVDHPVLGRMFVHRQTPVVRPRAEAC